MLLLLLEGACAITPLPTNRAWILEQVSNLFFSLFFSLAHRRTQEESWRLLKLLEARIFLKIYIYIFYFATLQVVTLPASYNIVSYELVASWAYSAASLQRRELQHLQHHIVVSHHCGAHGRSTTLWPPTSCHWFPSVHGHLSKDVHRTSSMVPFHPPTFFFNLKNNIIIN